MKYRKLPIVIEAFKLTNKNGTEQPEWILEAIESKEATVAYENGYFVGMDIKTPEGTMRANDGDYIIKGINGEIYPCKPDIFEKTYELADETAPKNKDLETIKAVVDNLTFSFEGTDEINMYDANAIADAAERMATAIELSDEISLKQTKRIEELENISNEFEKLVAKEKFYQTDAAIINLAKLESVQIFWNDKNKLAFQFPSNEHQDGQMHLKTFDTPEQAEAEYKRLAAVMTK